MPPNTSSPKNGKPKSRRRRGGQPGNLNALKHGFYSCQFRQTELGDLQTTLSNSLQDEIAMLRVIIRRVVEVTPQAKTFDQVLRLLNTLSHATTNLGRLVKIQHTISGGRTTLNDTLDETLEELLKDWKLKE